MLNIAESNEENRILYVLTALIDNYKSEIKINKDAIETLDYIFAKGKLSSEMKAIRPELNTESYIKIKQGRHPFRITSYNVCYTKLLRIISSKYKIINTDL